MRATAILPWALALTGCDASVEPIGDSASSSAEPPDELIMTDANNYHFTGSLQVLEIPVNAGEDAVIDWNPLTLDIRDQPITPSDVSRLDLVAFRATRDEVLSKISTNQLDQSDVAELYQYANTSGASSAMFSQFMAQNNYFQPAGELLDRSNIASWAILLEREAQGRAEIATMLFLALVGEYGEGTVYIGNESTVLDFEATLGEPLVTVQGQDYTLDWSQVTIDGSGQPFNNARVNQLFVGHVAETDADAIETTFVHLIESSEAIYGVDVYGSTSATLSDCVDAAGAPFPGFTSDGSWLVGLSCLACPSPAPLLLTRVDLR